MELYGGTYPFTTTPFGMPLPDNSILYYNFFIPNVLEGRYYLKYNLTFYSRYDFEGPQKVMFTKEIIHPIVVTKKKHKLEFINSSASFTSYRKDSINISYNLKYSGNPKYDPIIRYHLSSDTTFGSDVFIHQERTEYKFVAFSPRTFNDSNIINYKGKLSTRITSNNIAASKYVILEIINNEYDTLKTYKYIKIDGLEEPLGNTVSETHESILLYPNPSSTTVSINNTREIISVSFLDATGKNIQEFNNSFTNMDINSLNKGFYLVKIQQKNNIKTLKFIKI